MSETAAPKYERKDIQPLVIFLSIAILVTFSVIVQIATAGFLKALNDHTRETAKKTTAPAVMGEFPSPRLQIRPAGDLAALHHEETRLLTTYGWVDGKKGVVRIPIERAMQILAERGLPKTTAHVTPTQLMQERGIKPEDQTPEPSQQQK